MIRAITNFVSSSVQRIVDTLVDKQGTTAECIVFEGFTICSFVQGLSPDIKLEVKKTNITYNRVKLLKSNSTNTMFINYTMLYSDLEDMSKCLSLAIAKRVEDNEEKRNDSVIWKDDNYFGLSIKPSQRSVHTFLNKIRVNNGGASHTIVITLCLLERFLQTTGISLVRDNWMSILLISFILSTKGIDSSFIIHHSFIRSFVLPL
eukprot:TRINITY_DN3064_c0_g1_i1.p1 TRINITY_DN3064_c0_g1~~TRINITY_DN3064_c0_g1_i1.p1  ORF type:complete len:205 (-),score=33.10 TRINITY_DN3064_c0_g1_i1:382-996(-)